MVMLSLHAVVQAPLSVAGTSDTGSPEQGRASGEMITRQGGLSSVLPQGGFFLSLVTTQQ